MVKKIKEILKNKERVIDTLNIILGLLMLTALVVFWKTVNKLSMYLVIFSGGLMNLCNGYRYILQKEKKNMGYSMLLLGIVVLFLGVIIIIL